MPFPHLTTLPRELQEAILGQLSSFPDLLAAILCCRSLHDIFTSGKKEICTSILLNYLDDCDICPEAIVIWKASRISYPTSDYQFEQFFKTNLSKRSREKAPLFTFEEVKTIFRLQSIVSNLSSRFLAYASSALPADESKFPATKTETARVSRTFYRFELFCRLFKESKNANLAVISDWMNEFFQVFATWENEQLACVNQFLFYQIAPVFNEIAEHDVFWGEFAVEPATWRGNRDVQGIMMKGLDSVYKILTADDFKSKLEALTGGGVPQQRRSEDLYSALRTAHKIFAPRIIRVSTFQTEEEYKAIIQPPFFEDPDCGPFETWRWANESKTIDVAMNQTTNSPLRSQGYVMWDKQRIDRIGILKKHVSQFYCSTPYDFPSRNFGREWIDSWRRRGEIYMEGGRGWWDFNDESKVVWPDYSISGESFNDESKVAWPDYSTSGGSSKAPRDPRDSRVEPNSLDAAKKAILALLG